MGEYAKESPPPAPPAGAHGGGVVATEVVVPMLQALGIGSLLGVCLLGTILLFGGAWAVAGAWAAGAALWGTAVSGVVFIGQQRAMAITPSWVARQRVLLAWPTVDGEEQDGAPWRVINPRRGRAGAPLLPSGTMEHEVEQVGPRARPEIEEAFRVVSGLWGARDCSQETVCKLFGRRIYDKYVGGSRRRRDQGTESGRGVLDRAGVIEKEGGRWVITASVEEAYSWNPELRAYADARAQTGRQVESRQGRGAGAGV